MSRRPLFLIAAGGTALLVALFLLWQSTVSDAPTVAAPPGAEPALAEPAAPAPPSAGSAGSAGPAARAGRLATGGSPAPTRGAPSPAPAIVASPDSAESVDPMSNTENLHFGGTQMRAQHAAVEPLVRECVAKATTAGQRPTGTAMLTYVVAKQGDKYQIEDTSFDDDETTLAQGPLLECLHKTAKAMKYVGLPRRSQALVVMRRVKIDNGELAEYKHVGFSYLR
jgi:hypothetical protein